MDFYLYILYSPTSDKFYIGHSDDPWRRVEEHNAGKLHKFTSDYRPWKLAAVFRAGDDRGSAVKIESFIKKTKIKNSHQESGFIPKGTLGYKKKSPSW